MKWTMLDKRITLSHLGLLPDFLRENDPRPAAEQINERYAHGGGWSPFGKFEWELKPDGSIQYPGDPKMKPLAEAYLRNERIVFYNYALVAIFQPDGTFEVSRLD